MAVQARESNSSNNPKIRISAPHADLIHLADDHVRWRFGKHPRELLREVTPETEAFDKFLELADASPERILAFAKRNGVLGLCKHGLPTWHDRYCEPGFSDGAIIEPITSWRAISRAVGAVLLLKGSIDEPITHTQETRERWELDWRNANWLSAQLNERAGRSDCEVENRFCKLPLPELVRIRPFRLFGQRELANVVNEFLACSGIRLSGRYSKVPNQRRLELVAETRFGPNTFSLIALQLAQDWAGSKRVARCYCGKLFPAPPTSSPRRRNFCPECRQAGKPGTVHMAAYRHRMSTARRLNAQGATVEQIAIELGREPDLIRKWIKGR